MQGDENNKSSALTEDKQKYARETLKFLEMI